MNSGDLPKSRLSSIHRLSWGKNRYTQSAFRTVRSALTRLKLYTQFSTYKQPKLRIKMAAQSCACSTDANGEKEPNFQGQKPSV